MTPLKGKNRVTSPFGYRTHPLTGRYTHHNGIDSVAEDRNVRAIWNCVKTEAVPGYNYGRGNLVRLYYSNTLRVIFQHLASIGIKTGQAVKQGDVVGVMGTTGDSTGVHLHSEVQVLRGGTWVAINPSQYLNIPNKVGICEGNDNLDKKPLEPGKVVLYEYSSIVASPGDARDIEALLNEKDISFRKKELL